MGIRTYFGIGCPPMASIPGDIYHIWIPYFKGHFSLIHLFIFKINVIEIVIKI
jgi:hypothetical protein